MKRAALLCFGLALAATSGAEAQALSMQMSNGWKFAFSGNVNVFYIYRNAKTEGVGGLALVGAPAKSSAIGTGLLPAFATFEAMGREGNLDLGVHFGFAPQVSMGDNAASTFPFASAGARIDMRQVYLTFGDASWGQVLAGKQLGLFGQQAIVNDMTIFGLGTNIGTRGTSLGRIGFGYLYTDFRGQITYSSPAGKKAQVSIGIFEPTTLLGEDDASIYSVTELPRLEAQFVFKPKHVNLWIDGMVQSAKQQDGLTDSGGIQTDGSVTAYGFGGGLKFDSGGFALVGTGFYAGGLGSTFEGALAVDGGALVGDGIGVDGEIRNSYGYYFQATFTPKNSKITLGGSYGSNYLNMNDGDKAAGLENSDFFKSRYSIIGLFSYQITKSLRWLAEYTYSQAKSQNGDAQDTQNQFGTGFMLFY